MATSRKRDPAFCVALTRFAGSEGKGRAMDFTERYKRMDRYTRLVIDSLIAGIKAHQSQMLVANPGTGKSALVYDLAKNFLGYDVITIVGSQKEPTDITGFPKTVGKPLPNGDTVSVTEYAMAEWQFRILQTPKLVLFLDEYSNSKPDVQAAQLQIINERVFPDLTPVPKQTVIIGAMNPVETAADGYEISLPSANRIKFIPWEPSFTSWKNGLLDNWGAPDAISAEEMKWRRRVVEFLGRNPALVYKLPDGKATANAGSVYGFGGSPAQADIYKTAYPSNRSWTNLARELQYCERGDKKYTYDLIELSARGIVGYEATRKFMDYLMKSDDQTPDLPSILQDPSIVNWAGMNGNTRIGLVRSLMDYVLSTEARVDQKKRLALGVRFFSYLGNHDQAALVAGYLQRLIQALGNNDMISESRELIRVPAFKAMMGRMRGR